MPYVSQLREFVGELVRPLRQRILGVLRRGELEQTNDQEGVQLSKVSLLNGEVRSDLERLQNYGLTSHPPEGCEVLTGFVGGDQEHGFVLSCDEREKRLKGLAAGEVALWTDEEGQYLVLKRGGKVEISNGQFELVKIQNDLIGALQDGFVNTMIGPQKILNAADPIAAIKLRHDTFVSGGS